ncbi:MAG: hypothetical protein KBA53_03710 [Thermoclostridium sp.]|nr:hypothetical protein [Thermoclostridium sp.]
MQDFEKLGTFYLGKELDVETRKRKEGYLLYDSKDLTTHALCIGMTGSGKTGLCIGVLEEAAIDGIPALVIDPKGDMTNLLLSFPDLDPADFTPWVNIEEAKKKGLSQQDFGAAQAALWRKGLAEWEQDGQRIKAMREKTDFVVYTPGSTAGNPLSIVRLCALPSAAVRNDVEALNELASGTSGSLLGLLGIDADPIQSREHILISNILLSSWGNGQNLDLAGLIQLIQKPQFNQIGVMPLESFYPEKDRFALAIRFNNLLASPSFASWMQGIPLEIDKLLYTETGKPKISILSIAHLSDAERMFFVSLVLNQIVSWVRTQPGTSSLRAMLYMDEIFGYFPPVANPPSKAPLLTLLKQARAFGLGIMLTTQNPMDLDYKGLANMGTWFIGRLQTERDKNRLMDGLEGASLTAGQVFDRQRMDQLLSSLSSRVFLMNNIHDEQPVLFETRWCMSYLRGPLNRLEIQSLTKAQPSTDATRAHFSEPAAPAAGTMQYSAPAMAAQAAAAGLSQSFEPVASSPAMPASVSRQDTAPQLPDTVTQTFLPYRGSKDGLTYRAAILGLVTVNYEDKKNGISNSVEMMRLCPINDGLVPVDWNQSEVLELEPDALEASGASGATYLPLPAACSKKTSYTTWEADLAEYLYRNSSLQLYRNDFLKKVSHPDESERDFKIRLQQESREERDQAIDKLRKSYATKVTTLEERIRKAEQAVQREKDQAKDATLQTAISMGSTVLGALFGRKLLSSGNIGKAATAARGISRQAKQYGDVNRSKETVEAYRAQLAELEEQLQNEIDAITAKLETKAEDVTAYELRPLKRDCVIRALSLAWEPIRRDGN